MRFKLDILSTVGRSLKLCSNAIMQCEDRDTIVVEI